MKGGLHSVFGSRGGWSPPRPTAASATDCRRGKGVVGAGRAPYGSWASWSREGRRNVAQGKEQGRLGLGLPAPSGKPSSMIALA